MNASYFDAHNDTLTKALLQVNPIEFLMQGSANINLDQLSRLGAKGTCFAAFTDGTQRPPVSHTQILKMAALLLATATQHPSALALPYSRIQMPKSQESTIFIDTHNNKIPLPLNGVFTLEGGYSFTAHNWEKLLLQYAHLGVKMIAPVWNHSNDLAEGLESCFANGQASPSGLTQLGKSVLSHFKDHGILVDVSHMSPSSFWDTHDLNCGPLVASHSGAMALKSHPRNLTDAQLKAIAASGGMVNVVFCRTFIGSPDHASSQTVADHMDYIARLCGVQAVGIGSDYDGATMPVDMPRIENLDRLDAALKRKGYGHSDRMAMLGQNLEHLMEAHKSPWATIDYSLLIRHISTLPPNHMVTTILDGNSQTMPANQALELLESPFPLSFNTGPQGQAYTPSLFSLNLNLKPCIEPPLSLGTGAPGTMVPSSTVPSSTVPSSTVPSSTAQWYTTLIIS